jgi:site-specific DNA-methyltransferase (adenine-specific)
MSTVPDKHYELAIVAPPYGLPKRSTTGQGKLQGRILNNDSMKWDSIPDETYFTELFRVSKNQIIWGANNFLLPPTRGFICWDKVQPWENFSACEYAWTSFDCPAKLYKFDNRTGDKIHPTQKPIALYHWLLQNYAKQDDKILDTHVGSASSLIACHDLGFDADGCELDADYYRDALARLNLHRAQMQMFNGDLEGVDYLHEIKQ